MAQSYIIKNGLLYTPDLKTVIGVDVESNTFTGRVPFGAHFIDDEVFSDCPYETISLPDSIEKLGNNLFSGSKNLKSIKLPSYIDELPAYMLSDCTSLTKVTMPTQVLGFSEGVFNGCTSLEEIPFRAGIEEIPENFCSGCSSVKALVFPNDVKRILSCAAAFCTSLKAIVLPSGLEYLADDAFKGCGAIQNIRIDGENKKFFVKEDGCLYEKTENGEKLKIAVSEAQSGEVGFFSQTVDEESEDTFFSNEDLNEIDDTFSAEVSASEEEEKALQGVDIVDDVKQNIESVAEIQEEKNDASSVDEAVNDILEEEKMRENVSSDVAVSESELEMLSTTMEVLEDNTKTSLEDSMTEQEVENLSMEAEEQMLEPQEKVGGEELSSKTSILVSSAQFSKIIECSDEDKESANGELFVIAEKTIKDGFGVETFSKKLEVCCRTFVHIQNFKRVILLKGLPLDNDEFVQFYYHFMASKNVILACEASNPSSMSDYAKKVCEQSRISLDKNELIEQRKRISIKNDLLIKLVIQDIYEA